MEYSSVDYDLSGSSRIAALVDRATGELTSVKLDRNAVQSGAQTLVSSGVERAAILALPDHRWVVFYNVGTALYARVSEDGGDSWGAQETLPVTLFATTVDDGQARFVVAWLPQHRLLALVYTKLVSATARSFLTPLRRDDAGVWTQGVETYLGLDFHAALPRRHFILPLGDGSLVVSETTFVDNFGWTTTPTVTNRITNISGPGRFANPRYLVCVRAVELQSGLILFVGNTLGRDTLNLKASGAWASAVIRRVSATAWNGLRDSSVFPTPWLPGLANYIAKGPVTTYATGAQTAAGYCAAVGQMRRLPDGSGELLYHDRDGTLKFIRNRMTLYSYYAAAGSSEEFLYWWTDSRRDTWE